VQGANDEERPLGPEQPGIDTALCPIWRT
jgi:hypothetical protein